MFLSIQTRMLGPKPKERKQKRQREPWWKWHDSLTRFEGPIALALDSAFHDRWVLDGGTDYGSISATPSKGPPRGTALNHAENPPQRTERPAQPDSRALPTANSRSEAVDLHRESLSLSAGDRPGAL